MPIWIEASGNEEPADKQQEEAMRTSLPPPPSQPADRDQVEAADPRTPKDDEISDAEEELQTVEELLGTAREVCQENARMVLATPSNNLPLSHRKAPTPQIPSTTDQTSVPPFTAVQTLKRKRIEEREEEAESVGTGKSSDPTSEQSGSTDTGSSSSLMNLARKPLSETISNVQLTSKSRANKRQRLSSKQLQEWRCLGIFWSGTSRYTKIAQRRSQPHEFLKAQEEEEVCIHKRRRRYDRRTAAKGDRQDK